MPSIDQLSFSFFSLLKEITTFFPKKNPPYLLLLTQSQWYWLSPHHDSKAGGYQSHYLQVEIDVRADIALEKKSAIAAHQLLKLLEQQQTPPTPAAHRILILLDKSWALSKEIAVPCPAFSFFSLSGMSSWLQRKEERAQAFREAFPWPHQGYLLKAQSLPIKSAKKKRKKKSTEVNPNQKYFSLTIAKEAPLEEALLPFIDAGWQIDQIIPAPNPFLNLFCLEEKSIPVEERERLLEKRKMLLKERFSTIATDLLAVQTPFRTNLESIFKNHLFSPFSALHSLIPSSIQKKQIKQQVVEELALTLRTFMSLLNFLLILFFFFSFLTNIIRSQQLFFRAQQTLSTEKKLQKSWEEKAPLQKKIALLRLQEEKFQKQILSPLCYATLFKKLQQALHPISSNSSSQIWLTQLSISVLPSQLYRFKENHLNLQGYTLLSPEKKREKLDDPQATAPPTKGLCHFLKACQQLANETHPAKTHLTIAKESTLESIPGSDWQLQKFQLAFSLPPQKL